MLRSPHCQLNARCGNNDLKSTCREARDGYPGKRVQTGPQLVGCIILDYSRVAINILICRGRTTTEPNRASGFVRRKVAFFYSWAGYFSEMKQCWPKWQVRRRSGCSGDRVRPLRLHRGCGGWHPSKRGGHKTYAAPSDSDSGRRKGASSFPFFGGAVRTL
jgi:hypothetical protein